MPWSDVEWIWDSNSLVYIKQGVVLNEPSAGPDINNNRVLKSVRSASMIGRTPVTSLPPVPYAMVSLPILT